MLSTFYNWVFEKWRIISLPWGAGIAVRICGKTVAWKYLNAHLATAMVRRLKLMWYCWVFHCNLLRVVPFLKWPKRLFIWATNKNRTTGQTWKAHSCDKLNRICQVWFAEPDSRNDPFTIGSDTILWSWSADRIPQTPITIGSSDRENTKPNSLLPIKSRHKSFSGKFRIEITWSWLNEKRHILMIYFMTSQWEVWRRHLWVPMRERHGQFSARTQCLLTIQHGLDMPYLTSMCMWLTSLKIYKLLTHDRPCSSKCFPVVCGF